MKTCFSVRFFLLLICATSCLSALAGDIVFYGIVKQQDWIQTNSSGAIIDAGTPFRFQCFVDSSQPNVINSASLQVPGGGSRILQADGSDEFNYEQRFSSLSALNATYGSGTYSLTVDSENDFNVVQLSMPADAYPNAPQLSNFAAAQSIAPTSDFTLTWGAFSDGTVNDFVQLEVRDMNGDAVFKSAQNPGSPTSLNGTNTFIVIPANTLSSGQMYEVNLMFAKIATSDSSSIPGATGVIGFSKRTKIGIQTAQPAAAINFFGVIKAQNFVQTNDAAPVFPPVDAPFAFQTFVDATTTNFITSASVRSPNTVLHNLTSDGNGQSWAFQQFFLTQNDLNTSYGNGNYALTVNVQTTNYSVTLPLSGDNYPNTPQLTNFTAAQSINPSNNFTLYWNAFSGGTTNDFVQLDISSGNDHSVYQSGQPGQPGALNGTSPYFLQIPANTLSPGTAYTVQLLFARAVTLDNTTIPGAFGFSSYVKKTAAIIRTTGTPFTVQLQPIGFVNGQFQFKFNSRVGRGYQIQWADDLPNWGNLWFTNATSSETVFTDTFAVPAKRFYRVQEYSGGGF